MKKKVHIVPHCHWDREWYFTTSRSKIYLMKDLADILDVLEQQDEFRYFMLDAQASLLDDYLKWRPQDEERIKNLVKTNRLIIGPWYTQTDQLVISAESITRNLYYGIKRCKEIGNYMNVGYVPDSFGQSAQMPQIFKEFGIEDTLFWRGVSDDMSEKTEYKWQGSDGTTVNAYQIPYGYYIGGNIPEGEEDFKKFIQEQIIERISSRSTTDHLYFPNGFDQAPIRSNLPELVKRANEIDSENEYCISNIDEYIKGVKEANPELITLTGELVNGKHMRIHKSIFSSRSDLKQMNTQTQNYVTNVLEPLLTISYSLGNDYPTQVVADIWRLMFENAAHDSIGSCVSDTTNEDIYHRYKQIRDLSYNLVELHSRLIAAKIKNHTGNPITLTLFNTLPTKRKGVIEAQIYIPGEDFVLRDLDGNKLNYTIQSKENISDYVLAQTIRLNPSKEIYMPKEVYMANVLIETGELPALGYYQISMELNQENEVIVTDSKDTKIENEFYIIEAAGNGSVHIYDKQTGIRYENQAVLQENGDDGDSFNYSPPREDLIVSSLDAKADVSSRKSMLQEEMELAFTMTVPKDLDERSKGITSVPMPVCMKVSLKKGSPVIEFKADLDNQAKSHRLVVLFDTKIASACSVADQQFGLIERPVYLEEEMKLWEEHQKDWNEMPITIETMQSFVALKDESHGAVVIPKGVREYEIVGENYDTIALTLFRTYGFMGRENLIYRPGRASGEKIIATPDAQMIGNVSLEFSYYLYNGNFNDANVSNIAKEQTTAIECYQYADFLNGRLIFSLEDVEQTLEPQYSLFELEESNLTVSAVKKAEDDDGIIIRLYNGLLNQTAEGVLTTNQKFKECEYRRLDETPNSERQITLENGRAQIKSVEHCKVVTLHIK